jgi:histidinol dehydrogenase
VLPTSKGANTHGPLSVSDFIRRSSIGYVTAKGYPQMASVAHRLGTYEGFSSHVNAVSSLRDRYLKD